MNYKDSADIEACNTNRIKTGMVSRKFMEEKKIKQACACEAGSRTYYDLFADTMSDNVDMQSTKISNELHSHSGKLLRSTSKLVGQGSSQMGNIPHTPELHRKFITRNVCEKAKSRCDDSCSSEKISNCEMKRRCDRYHSRENDSNIRGPSQMELHSRAPKPSKNQNKEKLLIHPEDTIETGLESIRCQPHPTTYNVIPNSILNSETLCISYYKHSRSDINQTAWGETQASYFENDNEDKHNTAFIGDQLNDSNDPIFNVDSDDEPIVNSPHTTKYPEHRCTGKPSESLYFEEDLRNVTRPQTYTEIYSTTDSYSDFVATVSPKKFESLKEPVNNNQIHLECLANTLNEPFDNGCKKIKSCKIGTNPAEDSAKYIAHKQQDFDPMLKACPKFHRFPQSCLERFPIGSDTTLSKNMSIKNCPQSTRRYCNLDENKQLNFERTSFLDNRQLDGSESLQEDHTSARLTNCPQSTRIRKSK